VTQSDKKGQIHLFISMALDAYNFIIVILDIFIDYSTLILPCCVHIAITAKDHPDGKLSAFKVGKVGRL